jgi:hypothetical protein
MDNFNNSLIVKRGRRGEIISKFYIKNIKCEQVQKINTDYRYDFLTNISTYEIKTDYQYKVYKSLFIEFESKSRKSGIHTSEAINYIFICPLDFNDYLLIEVPTNTIKEIIKNNVLKIKYAPYFTYNDEKTNYINKGYILPIELLKDCSTIINFNESHEKYENLINYLEKKI